MPFTVVARCALGHPLVIRNRPTDEAGNPFPTLYWLTCPDTVKAVARLESEEWIRRVNERAGRDERLRGSITRAHEEYAAERSELHPGAEAWGGVGGAARGVKCLHAHYAYYLAGGRDPVGALVAKVLRERAVHYEKPGTRVAAIDLGTNSIRLLVARWAGEQLSELARDMVITRLGQGVDSSGRLAAGALRRTVHVMARYCRRARALGAERIHLAATSAVRDADNREELAAAVERLTAEPMEVLSGEEEARISFLGATRHLSLPSPFLVVDIGGGSTEFAFGSDDVEAAVSAQTGSVRLTERYVRSDPPSPQELDTIDGEIARMLGFAEQRVPVRTAQTLIAVAGTATTLQAIALGLPEYDPARIHRTMLSLADADRVFRLLVDMTTRERREIPVMAAGREDVIPAGAAVLVAVMHRWGFEQALISETDILDGLVLRMVE